MKPNRLRPMLVIALTLVPALARAQDAPKEHKVDVCVYGGTAGGVIAAVAAKKEGKTVLLIEPGRHLGGMSSGGLGWTDFGNKAAIGGMSLDFYKRVGKAKGRDDAVWTFEPSVAEAVFKDLVRESAVDVVFEYRVIAAAGKVFANGAGVRKSLGLVTFEYAPPQPSGAPAPRGSPHPDGARFLAVEAKVFIDATYEGDLLPHAGVKYHVGRESARQYGEPLNGIRPRTPSHQFTTRVDPYVKPGDASSGLLPLVQEGDGGTPGDGDHRVQAYNFRLCLTNVPENRNPIAAPQGYDPARYELLARHVESNVAAGKKLTLRNLLKIDMVTKEKTDINNQGAVSTDFIGANYDYPETNYARRGEIWNEHLRYINGLLYFLATSPRIPESIRNDMASWGTAKDEFTDTGGWPHQMYVREARRMVGQYVITQNDCEHRTTIDDAVGLGAYNMDSHNCQRIAKDGAAINEGDVQVPPKGPYKISYRSITPKPEECANLIVPVAISASHIAYGSARMEPVFMVLGESAAVAASMAIDADVPVQQVDVKQLQDRLLKAGQVLVPPPPGPGRAGGAGGTGKDIAKLGGLVADEGDAKRVELKGPWQPSRSTGGFVGDGYLHDADAAKGECTARFSLPVTEAGAYAVRVYYTSYENRATNVPVTVTLGDKSTTKKIDQKSPSPNGGGYTTVATVDAKAGDTITVAITNAGTDGHVVLDAVQAMRVPTGAATQ